MRRQGEDNLTEQVKNKLEAYSSAYNAESWERFNLKLDQVESFRKIASYKSFSIGLIIGLLFTSGMAYLIYTRYNKTNQQSISSEIKNLKAEIEILKITDEGQKLLKQSNYQTQPELHTQSSVVKKYFDSDYSSIPDNEASDELKYYKSQGNLLFTQNLINRFTTNKTGLSYLQARISPVEIENDYNSGGGIVIEPKDQMGKPQKKSKRNQHKFKFDWSNLDFKLNKDGYKYFTRPNTIHIGFKRDVLLVDDVGYQFQSEFGLDLSGPMSKRMNVSAGLHYGTISWKINRHHFEAEYSLDSLETEGVVLIDSIYNSEVSWQFLEIPINFSYKILQIKKSSFHINAGISAVFFLREKYFIESKNFGIGDVIDEEFSVFEHNHIPARISLGLNYQYAFNDKWSLSVHPVYKWNLQKNHFVNIKSSYWGLGLKLSYKFKKDKY